MQGCPEWQADYFIYTILLFHNGSNSLSTFGAYSIAGETYAN